MKILSIITLCLAICNPSFAQTAPPAPEQRPIQDRDISKFNQRLEKLYHQSNNNTLMQQIIYGSFEAIAAFKLSGLIPTVDQKKIGSISTQLRALRDPGGADYIGADHASQSQKAARIRSLERELKSIEGGIFKRMGRGTAKILVRGTQIFLVLDVGARIYILNNLDQRDPGFVPAYTFLCNQVDCEEAVDQVIDTSNEVYVEARQVVEPRRLPPAEPVVVPVQPTTPTPQPKTPPAPPTPPQPQP